MVNLSFSHTQVADCICLMSLSHLQSVPVDTHVYQIAVNHYSFAKSTSKTLTPGVYNEIRAFFIEKFGPYAGWAHSILFCADLKKFQTKSPEAKSKGKRRKVSGWPLGGNNLFYAQAILFWKISRHCFRAGVFVIAPDDPGSKLGGNESFSLCALDVWVSLIPREEWVATWFGIDQWRLYVKALNLLSKYYRNLV